MKTKKMAATAIKIMVNCVVVTRSAMEGRWLSIFNLGVRFGFYMANIEKNQICNPLILKYLRKI
jgi:hypothetical protein